MQLVSPGWDAVAKARAAADAEAGGQAWDGKFTLGCHQCHKYYEGTMVATKSYSPCMVNFPFPFHTCPCSSASAATMAAMLGNPFIRTMACDTLSICGQGIQGDCRLVSCSPTTGLLQMSCTFCQVPLQLSPLIYAFGMSTRFCSITPAC